MAQGYKINGLAALQNKLKNLSGNIKSEAIEDIQDAADAIVIKAGNAAPVDLGVLKQNIGNEPKNGGLDYIVFANAEYAPYVEFGTGTEINIPSGLSDYAKQFKGEGKKQVNLPARPFFFPAYFEERAKLIKKLKATISKNL